MKLKADTVQVLQIPELKSSRWRPGEQKDSGCVSALSHQGYITHNPFGKYGSERCCHCSAPRR